MSTILVYIWTLEQLVVIQVFQVISHRKTIVKASSVQFFWLKVNCEEPIHATLKIELFIRQNQQLQTSGTNFLKLLVPTNTGLSFGLIGSCFYQSPVNNFFLYSMENISRTINIIPQTCKFLLNAVKMCFFRFCICNYKVLSRQKVITKSGKIRGTGTRYRTSIPSGLEKGTFVV